MAPGGVQAGAIAATRIRLPSRPTFRRPTLNLATPAFALRVAASRHALHCFFFPAFMRHEARPVCPSLLATERAAVFRRMQSVDREAVQESRDRSHPGRNPGRKGFWAGHEAEARRSCPSWLSEPSRERPIDPSTTLSATLGFRRGGDAGQACHGRGERCGLGLAERHGGGQASHAPPQSRKGENGSADAIARAAKSSKVRCSARFEKIKNRNEKTDDPPRLNSDPPCERARGRGRRLDACRHCARTHAMAARC